MVVLSFTDNSIVWIVISMSKKAINNKSKLKKSNFVTCAKWYTYIIYMASFNYTTFIQNTFFGDGSFTKYGLENT